MRMDWKPVVWVVTAIGAALVCASRVDATGYLTGYGQFERIAGNPAMGYQQLYEWDLFLSPTGNSAYVGPSRRLGAPPGQTPTGDGYYRIDDVPAGDYSVYVNQPDFFASPKVVPNVRINDGQGTTLNVNLDVDYSTYFGNNGWTEWRWDNYQVFTATGSSVRGVSWRLAGSYSSDKSAVIRILEDNGNANPSLWTPIGSATDGRINGDSDEWVRFTSGQVPLTSGKQYAVHIHVDGGMAVYKRDKDGSSYAGGRAYDQNGQSQNYDLNVTVFVDKPAPVLSMVTHTRKSSGPGVFDGMNNSTRWTQSFMATGTSLAAVDLFAAGGSGFDLRWRILEGGANGTQVGPTKTVRSAFFASSTGLAGVSYDPGEVTLTPGLTYFIEAYNASGFTPYVQEGFNAYADGQAFKNGAPTSLDLAMTIVEYHIVRPDADRNGDGSVNALDIDAMFANPIDLNLDGIANNGDVDYLIRTVLNTDYGDLNLDGLVGLGDYIAMRQRFGLSGTWATGDLNGDLLVDFADLRIFKDHFPGGAAGLEAALQAVPAPATVWAGIIGLCAAGLRRRRSV